MNHTKTVLAVLNFIDQYDNEPEQRVSDAAEQNIADSHKRLEDLYDLFDQQQILEK
jgi:predicted RNA binding protein with dsRBD fold (UPF0201 family)